jgi:hypothetical protein
MMWRQCPTIKSVASGMELFRKIKATEWPLSQMHLLDRCFSEAGAWLRRGTYRFIQEGRRQGLARRFFRHSAGDHTAIGEPS